MPELPTLREKEEMRKETREKIQFLCETSVAAGQDELERQPELIEMLLGIAFEGKWPDGKEVVDEKLRMKAMGMLHSKIPRIVAGSIFKYQKQEEVSKEIRINLRLDGLPDPTVTREEIEDVHKLMLEAPVGDGSADA